MPGRKRARTTTERGFRPSRVGSLRRAQRKRGGKNAMVSVPRNKLNFPVSMRTKLRYSKKEVFEPVVYSNAKFRTYRGNSIWDPEYALGGHKPRGSDQFFAVYDTYTVVSAKISVNFMYSGYDAPSQTNTGAMIKTIAATEDLTTHIPAQPPVICAIHRSSADYVAGHIEAQLEKDKTIWVAMNPSSDCKSLSTKATTQEFFGKEALVGSEGYTGTAATSPSEEWFFHIIVSTGDDTYAISGLATKIVAFVTVEYDVIFTDPKQLAAS